LPFFVVAIALTALNVWFQTHGTSETIRSATFLQRLAGAGAVPWFYLSKALVPIDLVFIYPQWHIETNDWLWWLPFLSALMATVVLMWLRNSSQANWDRSLLFAWIFFCLALLPVLGFTDVGFMRFSLVADHYQHIALIGVVTLGGAAWDYWRQQARGAVRTACTVTAVAVASTLMFLTWQQSRLYGEPITLYRATLEKNPTCWVAYNNLGVEYQSQKRMPEAIDCFERALKLNPDYSDAHYNLGRILLDDGSLDEAIKQYQLAIKSNPAFAKAYCNLGNVLKKSGSLQDALGYYERALELDPNIFEAQYNFADCLVQLSRPQEAVGHYEAAVQLMPSDADSWINLATTYARLKNSDAAIAAGKKALELASSQGRTELVQRIAEWLTLYSSGQLDHSENAPQSKSNLSK
jgi:tetratricopeptide (TPR) repeat protein